MLKTESNFRSRPTFLSSNRVRDVSTQRPSITATFRFIFPDISDLFSLFATPFRHSRSPTNLPAPLPNSDFSYSVITNYRNRNRTFANSPTTACDSCCFCFVKNVSMTSVAAPSTSFRAADDGNLRDWYHYDTINSDDEDRGNDRLRS